jgi:hypothetical protein
LRPELYSVNHCLTRMARKATVRETKRLANQRPFKQRAVFEARKEAGSWISNDVRLLACMALSAATMLLVAYSVWSGWRPE